MGKINKKDVKIFNHLGEVVDDVLARCKGIVSLKDVVGVEAVDLDNQSESFAIDCMGKQHEVEVGFSTTCDTEHCIVFEVCDKEFRIKHHQDQFQCYDKMPIVITELTALAESLLGAVADYWADVPHDKRVKLDAGLAGIIKRLDNAAYVATEDDPSQTSVDVFNDVLAELLEAVGAIGCVHVSKIREALVDLQGVDVSRQSDQTELDGAVALIKQAIGDAT